MKKVVFVCSGSDFPKGAFEFVKSLQAHQPVLVAGAFFYPVNNGRAVPTTFDVVPQPIYEPIDEGEDAVAQSIVQFEKASSQNNIEYKVHRESTQWNLDDLAAESRFADMLVVSEEKFYADADADQPNGFLKRLMRESECPVMLVPEDFTEVKKIIIAFDGKKESMFALKQFCYLLPQLADLETEVIYLLDDDEEDKHTLAYLEEFIGRRFKNLNLRKLDVDAKDYINNRTDQKNTLIITGSYSRSGSSVILRESFLDKVIHDHSFMIFIAHPA